MPGFDESSAKRISRSVLWSERMQGIPSTDPNDNYGSTTSSICLVRTDTTLPAGYTGAMAVLGDVVEKQSDNTVNTLGQVWIKDVNGGTLSANTIYQARVGGTFAQNLPSGVSTTLGLYLVQSSGAGTSTGWQLYEYRGASASSSLLTIVNLETAATATLLGNPLGIDAPGLSPMFGLTPRIWAKPVGGLLQIYNVTPFSFFAKATSVVDDGYGNDIAYLESLFPPTVGYMATFRAKDPTKAFRANYSRYGVLPKVSVAWSPINYPFATPANQFPYLITAAEVLQTTSGISTGIGPGISGV